MSNGIVGPGGKPVIAEIKPTDIITISVNMDKKAMLEFTVTPGIKGQPLEGAKILMQAGMAMLENVVPRMQVKDKIHVATVPLREMMARLKTIAGGK